MSNTAAAHAVPATPSPPPARARSSRAGLAAFVLPIYFIVGLAATLVVALHDPHPHDMALTIAGPSASVTQVAQGLERSSGDSFDITTSTDPASARASVARREAVGAIVLGGTQDAPTVTTYVASAGGRSAATAVQTVGAQLAAQQDIAATVVEVAPLNGLDTLGTGLFYVFAYSSIGGYLTLIVLTQVLPKSRLRVRYGAALGAGVLAPTIVFGLASIFFGGWGASFGQICALLGVMALYAFTVGLVVIVWEQLLGQAAIFGVMPFVVFLNLPSAGGASPESMLPGFFQAIHSFWFGSGGFEAIRDIVYFPDADPVRWIVQLLLWTIGLLVVTLLIEAAKMIWRLQTVVIRQQKDSNTLQKHLELLSVPKQAPLTRHAITATATAPSARTTTDAAVPAGPDTSADLWSEDRDDAPVAG